MKEKMNNNTELIDFEVQIPNLEGDGIADVHTIKVPARRSTGGEWILTKEALEQIEQTQARYMGLMTPGEIRDLRLRIQFTQRQMSELIQAGEKSYTRWENGRVRLSRLVNIILCSIRDGFLPVTYLQTLYEEGCDWYKKVKTYEKHAKAPVFYKMKQTPVAVEMNQPVVSTNPSPAESRVGAWRSNWLSSISLDQNTNY
jgi:DNA-binding transcriptional regulator YiaG